MSGAAGNSESLQTLVDALSATLQRPVLLDDAALRPLAYSAHSGDVELVRRDSIQKRVCGSARDDRDVLGYLWVFDPHDELDDDALGRVASAARDAARVLVATEQTPAADERALVARLCSERREEREHAALEVRSRELLPDGPLVVCAIAPAMLGADAWSAARRMVHGFTAARAVAGSASIGAVLLASVDDPLFAALSHDGLASWLRASVKDEVAVGQSGVVDDLAGVLAGRRQAELALRIALRGAPQRAHASWHALGAECLVAQLPASARADLPPRLTRLLTDEPTLAATLAAFLDAAGDVKATAARLDLHRSGLYYRLRRIEELTGLRLDDGDDRLLAHLGVRLAQLG